MTAFTTVLLLLLLKQAVTSFQPALAITRHDKGCLATWPTTPQQAGKTHREPLDCQAGPYERVDQLQVCIEGPGLATELVDWVLLVRVAPLPPTIQEWRVAPPVVVLDALEPVLKLVCLIIHAGLGLDNFTEQAFPHNGGCAWGCVGEGRR